MAGRGDKVPNCVGLAPGRRVALAKSTPRALLIIDGVQPEGYLYLDLNYGLSV